MVEVSGRTTARGGVQVRLRDTRLPHGVADTVEVRVGNRTMSQEEFRVGNRIISQEEARIGNRVL